MIRRLMEQALGARVVVIGLALVLALAGLLLVHATRHRSISLSGPADGGGVDAAQRVERRRDRADRDRAARVRVS